MAPGVGPTGQGDLDHHERREREKLEKNLGEELGRFCLVSADATADEVDEANVEEFRRLIASLTEHIQAAAAFRKQFLASVNEMKELGFAERFSHWRRRLEETAAEVRPKRLRDSLSELIKVLPTRTDYVMDVKELPHLAKVLRVLQLKPDVVFPLFRGPRDDAPRDTMELAAFGVVLDARGTLDEEPSMPSYEDEVKERLIYELD